MPTARGASWPIQPPHNQTPATLPAAIAPLAGSLSDPLAAPGGWVGTLAPRGAAPRSRVSATPEMQPHWGRRAWDGITGHQGGITGPLAGPGPPAPRDKVSAAPGHTPGAPRRGAGAARGRSGGWARRAPSRARCPRTPKSVKTAQVPLGETVQGDPGDPPGRSETPSGQPQQPLGGAGWLDWPAGTSRGRRAASRLSGVMKYPYRAQIRRNLVL